MEGNEFIFDEDEEYSAIVGVYSDDETVYVGVLGNGIWLSFKEAKYLFAKALEELSE